MKSATRARGGGLLNPRRQAALLAQVSGQSGAGGGIVAPVSSVAGRVGAVVLTAADFGAGTFPGDVVFTTASTGVTQTAADSTTKLATTAFATTADNLKANLASPTFTGTVTIPNASGATDMLAYGQVPIPGSVGGPAVVVARTGDATPIQSSATFANDDTLQFTVGANDRWLVEGFLTFTAADGAGTAATADIKTGWSLPASATMQHALYGLTTNSVSAYGSAGTSATPTPLRTAAQSSNAGAIGSAAVTSGVTIAGFYTGGGTGGTVHLQWAQSTSDASTLQINKNSVLLAWRIA